MKTHSFVNLAALTAALVAIGAGAAYTAWGPRSETTLQAEALPTETSHELTLPPYVDTGATTCPDETEIEQERVREPEGGYCVPELLTFGQATGPLHAGMSLASLKAACGDVLVSFISYLGEGRCRWETALYPGTEREVHIAWLNWRDQTTPASIRFIGSAFHFDNGFGPGMPLDEVTKLNGKAISLQGFGLHDSGVHRSFQGGSLERFDQKTATRYQIRYGLDWELLDGATDEENASVIPGEGTIESTVPALSILKARVESIEYILRDPP